MASSTLTRLALQRQPTSIALKRRLVLVPVRPVRSSHFRRVRASERASVICPYLTASRWAHGGREIPHPAREPRRLVSFFFQSTSQ